MKWISRLLVVGCAVELSAGAASAQLASRLEQLSRIPAVAGYEQNLAAHIRGEIQQLAPKTDNLGNVYVTLGSGAPHRLIVTPMDEPGYIVSEITPDGYLRVQRLPQAPPTPVFDLLHSAQPVWVTTRSGKKVTGVFAGLSVHLQPLRQNAPKMAHPDEIYVDIGASNASEVHAAGVNLLDPIALVRDSLLSIGDGGEIASPASGDRFGCAVLLELLQELREAKITGTLTVAFVTQQWTGGRGLDRLLNEIHPDEMIFVGRLQPPRSPSGQSAPQTSPPVGSGVLLGVTDPKAPRGEFQDELRALAEQNHISFTAVAAAPPRIAGYAKPMPFPQRFSAIGVPTFQPVTPAEVASSHDARAVQSLLEAYLHLPVSLEKAQGKPPQSAVVRPHP